MHRVYLGIGGNIGERKKNIDDAISLLDNNPKINITKISSYYETEPIGYKAQDWFINVVVEAETDFDPFSLLDICNDIENKLKRVRLIHWGPRTIDIDILLYDDLVLNEEKLTIPHPRMKERAFVIVPLEEIVPDMMLGNEKIHDVAKRLNNQEIRKYTG